jgi:hypothetical protein
MLATAPLPTADRPPTSAAAARIPTDVLQPLGRRCPHCCADIAREAKKCRTCGEWVVGTSSGAAAALLRMLGWLWVGLSLFAGAGLWYVGSVVRLWVLVRSVDPAVTPLVLDVILYGLVSIVLLQGLTFGVALAALADRVPRRPRWWS